MQVILRRQGHRLARAVHPELGQVRASLVLRQGALSFCAPECPSKEPLNLCVGFLTEPLILARPNYLLTRVVAFTAGFSGTYTLFIVFAALAEEEVFHGFHK